MNKKALILGIILGAVAMRIFLVASAPEVHNNYDHEHVSGVHVHADFMMILDGRKIDLTQDKYQSKAGDTKHADIHLHDNQGNIIHRHADGVTFGDFISSIGLTLTEDCLNLDTGEQYCNNEENNLLLLVNGERYSPIESYIINDEDQTLFYYGPRDSEKIIEHQNTLTDEACIYSGTCPERGTPPPEACGLTCEVAPEDLDY